jgi:hypothetical protein
MLADIGGAVEYAAPRARPTTANSCLMMRPAVRSGSSVPSGQYARDYLLRRSPGWELRNHWQYAYQLILEEADVKAVTWQFHRALFMDGQLDLVVFESIRGRNIS